MTGRLMACACLAMLVVCAFLGGSAREAEATIRIHLVDATTGQPLSGIIRVKDTAGGPIVRVGGLLDRLKGLQVAAAGSGWYVVPAAGGDVSLPRRALRLEAVHGLETAAVQQELDLNAATPNEITIKMPFLFRPEKQDLVAGNTHLHLRNMTRADADDYLRNIPTADGLRVLFISYLERHLDDRSYITNQYPPGDLKDLSGSVILSNGEEHRHNFDGFSQGYGHVMLLGIKELVKPVSLGPGITKAGNDDRPLRPGMDDARRQGGTVIWCHNTFGYESVPDMLAGRLDALNVFDGSRRDAYEDLYYRLLNLGLRVPISTGTDWFLYDFSRVYATVPGRVTSSAWLAALKRGETVATNGPLLTLKVAGSTSGKILELKQPGRVRVEAAAIGRLNFNKLQLIRNGTVVHTQTAAPANGGYAAEIIRDLYVDGPAWLAVRIETSEKNEFDQQLFAHSSPVYLDFAGRRVFDVESARAFLRLIEEATANIRARGTFSGPAARDKLLSLYEEAVADLRGRINRRGG